MLTEIDEEIAKKGFAEIPAVALANLSFRSTPDKSSQQQLEEWCQKKGYSFEIFDLPDVKKSQQWVRFFPRR